MAHIKLFKSGNSQAVHIPTELAFMVQGRGENIDGTSLHFSLLSKGDV